MKRIRHSRDSRGGKESFRWWPPKPGFMRFIRVAGFMALGFGFGIHFAAVSPRFADLPTVNELQRRLAGTRSALTGRSGEVSLMREEIARLSVILRQSTRYDIPADLATSIYDIAREEGIEPRLGYSLVRTESGFDAEAVSDRGAVGLTQVLPSTADELQPGITDAELLDPETNLHLGFRYLRIMLRKYDGDLRLALLAYNRGPGTVDTIRGRGLDPANGYARAVMDRAQ